MRAFAAALILFLLAGPAAAVQPDEQLSDPGLESRAREISAELRCLVCQNQSIDDSDAPLARDLRLLVRDRLQAGDSDEQVLDFLVARYGEFVLLRPRLSIETVLLWGTPLIALGIGALVAMLWLRRSAQSGAAESLSSEEEAALERIRQGRAASGPHA